MLTVAFELGFTLDEEMYELSRSALGECAPEQVASFTWERFVTRENWTLVPDIGFSENLWYKAEFTIKLAPPYEQTIILNLWQAPDINRGFQPFPHKHPWPFKARLLKGGYKEDRYTVRRPSSLHRGTFVPTPSLHVGLETVTHGVVHQAGDVNSIDDVTFHEIVEILEPGRTLSLMDCGPGVKGDWGYLDLTREVYIPITEYGPDPQFEYRLRKLNPHRR